MVWARKKALRLEKKCELLTRSLIYRRDRVTFTGSIGTKFVGINVKNDDLRGLAQSA